MTFHEKIHIGEVKKPRKGPRGFSFIYYTLWGRLNWLLIQFNFNVKHQQAIYYFWANIEFTLGNQNAIYSGGQRNNMVGRRGWSHTGAHFP